MSRNNSRNPLDSSLADEFTDKILANDTVRRAVEETVPYVVDGCVSMSTGSDGLGKLAKAVTKVNARAAAEYVTHVAVNTAIDVFAPVIVIGGLIYSIFDKEE